MTLANQQLFIVEGPDGAGKSALARRLVKRLGAVDVHHGDYRWTDGRGLLRLYHDTMLPALRGDATVVLDRAWHSEEIYGNVFRDGPRLDNAQLRMLERLRLSVPSTLVYVRQSLEASWRIVAARATDELSQRYEQHLRVHGAYEAASWLIEAVIIDRTRDQRAPDEFAAALLDTALAETERLADRYFAARRHCVIGNVAHSTRCALLVGEQAPDTDSTVYPFISFSRGGCSHWLTTLLDAARIDERRLLWMNAVDASGNDADVDVVVRALQPRCVIAMGRTADVVLAQHGVKADMVVPHPQYVKRFQHTTDPHQYGLISALRAGLA